MSLKELESDVSPAPNQPLLTETRFNPIFIGAGRGMTRANRIDVFPDLMFDPIVHLLSMHRDLLGRGDTQTHLVALHPKNLDLDVVTDRHDLMNVAGEYQHGYLLRVSRLLKSSLPVALEFPGHGPLNLCEGVQK
jgi:hypothetical protein